VGRTNKGQVHDLSERALQVSSDIRQAEPVPADLLGAHSARRLPANYGTTMVSPAFNSMFCSVFFPLMTSL